MLIHIWMCVMLQAFAPGGERLAAHYMHALQGYVWGQIEPFAPVQAAPARPTPTERVRQMRTTRRAR